jgi:transposase
MADWFDECGVTIVAMESTGVYWIPLYEVLERRGFQVLLVNARDVKNVSGRKSDVLDCQWLQQLLTFGLLRGAFRPADHMCALAQRCAASAPGCCATRAATCSTCKRR